MESDAARGSGVLGASWREWAVFAIAVLIGVALVVAKLYSDYGPT